MARTRRKLGAETADAMVAAPASRPVPFGAIVAGLLAVYVLAFNLPDVRLPLNTDDYMILNRVWNASFAALWSRENLPFSYYRPWSRELHFWSLFHLFGTSPIAFRLVSYSLWVGVMLAYFALVRRWIGPVAAAISCCGVAALASWESTLLWPAGAQELWLLLFGLLYLLAHARGRTALGLLPLAGALMSKETAVVLPAIALLSSILLERDRLPRALARIAPSLALCGLWLVIHPTFGTHFSKDWRDSAAQDLNPLQKVTRSVLGLVDLHPWPDPEEGAGRALLRRGLAAAALIAMVCWAMLRKSRRPEPAALRNAAWLGASWAVVGWLPALSPFLGWHPYYTLLGSFGAWILLGALLQRARVGAIVVIAWCGLMQPLQSETLYWNWSNAAYQRRALDHLERLRSDLMTKHPTIPRHSRFYFGWLPWEEILPFGTPWFNSGLQFWYRDTTLTSGLFASYDPPPPGETDFFFRFDSSYRWIELHAGPEDLARARREDPQWEDSHRRLAVTFGDHDDWNAAAREWTKLAQAVPESAVAYAGYARNRAQSAPK